MPNKIYAFYGLGKTTLATQHPDLFYDDDPFVPNKEPYRGQPYVLTNNPDEDCDLYFLPHQLEDVYPRLKAKMDFFNQYKTQDGRTLLEFDYNRIQEKNPTYVDYMTLEAITKG